MIMSDQTYTFLSKHPKSGSLMGGRTGKPITLIEKRQRRLMEEEMRRRVREQSRTDVEASKQVFFDEELIKRAIREIRGQSYVTPYMLMNKLNVVYGVAKDILEVLEKRSVVKLYSKNRRVAIYVPVHAA